MSNNNTISYFFPLDNMVDGKIPNINESELTNAIIDFDTTRGSYLKFNNNSNNFIQQKINAPIADKQYSINFFVKFDEEQAFDEFLILDNLCKISIDAGKNITVNGKNTNFNIEINNWYNFTLEIKDNNLQVLLFKDEISRLKLNNDTSEINDFKLAGANISFSRWSIQEHINFDALTQIRLNQIQPSDFDYSDIRFSLYNEHSIHKNLLEITDNTPHNLILEIDFGKHNPLFNDEINIGTLSAKKGFFSDAHSTSENDADWSTIIKKDKCIINGNIFICKIEGVEILNLTDQNQVLLHLMLENFGLRSSIQLDRPMIVKDNRGLIISPFDCYIIDGDTFTYLENYDQFKGQDLTVTLENITDENLVLTKDKTTFSIDLSRFNLFAKDKLQTKNITIRHKDKTITYKLITNNDTVLEFSLTQEISLQPQEYLQFTIPRLKIKPSANSVGKFPFYINYKNVTNYRNGKCKFIIQSTIIKTDDYEGNWQNGKKNGQGKLTWADGDVYEGEFKDGNRDGHGKFVYFNGDIYDGTWGNNKQLEGSYEFKQEKSLTFKNSVRTIEPYQLGKILQYRKGIFIANKDKYKFEFKFDKRTYKAGDIINNDGNNTIELLEDFTFYE